MIGLVRALPLLLLLPATLASARERGKPAVAATPARPSDIDAQSSTEKPAFRDDEVQRAMAARDFAKARQLLEKSWRRAAHPQVLYLLGKIALSESQRVAAQDFFRRFVAEPNSQPDRGMLEEVRRLFAGPRPAQGELDLLGADGSLVFIDDRLVGSLPLSAPLLLPTGPHTLRVEPRGRALRGKVDITAGRLVQVRFSEESDAIVLTTPPRVLIITQWADSSQAKDGMQRALERGARRAGLVPMRASIDQKALGAACAESISCHLDSARQQGIEHVLLLSEQRGSGVQLLHLDTQVGDEAARAAPSCPSCDAAQLESRLITDTETLLLQGLGRSRGKLAITTQPPGAEVRRGKVLLGRTPYEGTAWVGSIELGLSRSGYAPQTVQITVAEDRKASQDVVLQLLPFVQRRPLWRLVSGALALTSGALLIGFGISAVAVRDACIMEPPEGVLCREYYGTLVPGVAMISVGVAVAATGAVLIALPRRTAP